MENKVGKSGVGECGVCMNGVGKSGIGGAYSQAEGEQSRPKRAQCFAQQHGPLL